MLCSTDERARALAQSADTIRANPKYRTRQTLANGTNERSHGEKKTIILCAIFGTHYLFIKKCKEIEKRREDKKKNGRFKFFGQTTIFCSRSSAADRFYVWFCSLSTLCSDGRTLFCALLSVGARHAAKTAAPSTTFAYINHINLFREKKNKFQFAFWTDKTQNGEQYIWPTLSQSVSGYIIIMFLFTVSSKCQRLNWTACVWLETAKNCTDHKSDASMVARLRSLVLRDGRTKMKS